MFDDDDDDIFATTPLKNVVDWDWALYKITWLHVAGDHDSDKRVMWVVAADSPYDECQDRWPSDYWVQFEFEYIASVSCPPRLPNNGMGGTRLVDCWDYGWKLAKDMGLAEI